MTVDKLLSSLGLSVLVYKMGITTSVLLKLIILNAVITGPLWDICHVTDVESFLISEKIIK